MNIAHHFDKKLILVNVLLSLAIIGQSDKAKAACIDNGDGTQTCSGSTTLTDGKHEYRYFLNNATAPVSMTNQSDPTSANYEVTPQIVDWTFGFPLVLQEGEYGSIITGSASSVGDESLISATGPQSVVVNNIGATISLINGSRSFNNSAWSTDANGLLYNNGVLASYIGAIYAGSDVASLTVNNEYIDNGIYYPETYYKGVNATISASSPYAASILTNSALLTVNNSSFINGTAVVSYAGATYTPPAVLDGTQQATNVTAGTTIINNIQKQSTVDPLEIAGIGNPSMGDIYVVDVNPLITAALQADPALALTLNTKEVGPRNSVINNIGFAATRDADPLLRERVNTFASIQNIYLGSGQHVVNNINANISGTIYVDQTASEVTDVGNTLYTVHGDREFTLNHLGSGVFSDSGTLGGVNINDVVGSVNTLNIQTINERFNSNIQANGLGLNVINFECAQIDTIYAQRYCDVDQLNFTGMTEFNTYGSGVTRFNTNKTVLGDFGINSRTMINLNSTLTADNVVVGSQGALIATPGSLVGNVAAGDIPRVMGNINANLINNGTVDVADATLDVSGDSIMNAGSKLIFAVGPMGGGLLNTAGTTYFNAGSLLMGTNSLVTRVYSGQKFMVATNISGLPTLQQTDSFLQWSQRDEAGNLIVTANFGVPETLKPMVSTAAQNAVVGLYSYTGDVDVMKDLQIDVANLSGIEAVRAAERLRPEVNDGAIRMVLGNTDKVFNMVSNRLSDDYLAQTANKAGPLKSNLGLWVQGFGDRGTQQGVDNVDGYGFSSVGFAAGMDREVNLMGSDLRLGLAGAFARSNIVNSGNTVNNRIDSNSYLLSAYGSKSMEDYYVNAAIGVGRNTYDGKRQLLKYSSDAEYDGWQLSGRLDAGIPFVLSDAITVAPMAAIDYSFVRQNGYQENSTISNLVTEQVPGFNYPVPVIKNGLQVYEDVASPTNLEVEKRDFKSYRGGIGGKLVYAMQNTDWAGELELHGMFRHEFGDIAPDTIARFAAGGDKFVSPSVLTTRNDFVFGASVKLTSDDDDDMLTILAGYDANLRKKYFGQAVSLNIRYDFDKAEIYQQKAQLKLAELRVKRDLDNEKLLQSVQKDREAPLPSVEPTEDPKTAKERREVHSVINNWASAISNKNTDVYFNTYAANFVSQDGMSRRVWERERKAEIKESSNSAVKLSELTIEPLGSQALAVFIETVSDGERTIAMEKILEFEKKGNRWLIVSEDSTAHE